jgi:DNA polymerase III sliding clamp (beta) subunit (PCNA family)
VTKNRPEREFKFKPSPTFRIPHSAFRISHCRRRRPSIPHSAFRIPHSAFRISHCRRRRPSIPHSKFLIAAAGGPAAMKKSTLLNVVRRLAPATLQGHSNPPPALFNVRITRDAAGWHFARMNLELFIAVTVPEPTPLNALAAKVAAARAKREAADFLIPYRTLNECAKAADKDTEITFLPDTRDKGTMHALRIQIAGATCTIPAAGDLPQAFPNEPDHPPTPHTAPITDAIAAAFETCQRCISTDETRYVLNGALWAKDDRHFPGTPVRPGSVVVSTDGRRLYFAGNLPPAPCESVIIPTAAVKLIRAGQSAAFYTDSCEPGTDETITTASRLVLSESADGLTIRTHARTVEGNYPNWKQVVPSEHNFSIRFDREQTGKCLKSMNRILADTSNTHNFRLTVGTGCVTFSMNKPEIGLAKATCPALITDPNKRDFSIAFNPEFFLDALGMGFDTVELIDNLSAGVLRHPRRTDEKYILMPMRVTA